MTVITDYLPWLKGWKYHLLPPTNYVIPAGGVVTVYDTKPIWKKEIDGYILGLGGCMTEPTTILEIFHSGPKNQQRTIQGTPFALNAMGVQYPNASGFWVGTYNAQIPLYCAFYHPPNRLGTFIDYLQVNIRAPVGLPTAVTGFFLSIIEISDKKEWVNSMRRLFQSNVFHVKEAKGKAKT